MSRWSVPNSKLHAFPESVSRTSPMTTNTDTQAHGGGVENDPFQEWWSRQGLVFCKPEETEAAKLLCASAWRAALSPRWNPALAASPAAPAPAAGVDRGPEEARWNKPAPELPRDFDAAYPIVRDAVLAASDPSARFIQNRYAIGYNRACSFIERMEAEGLVTSWQADIGGRRIASPAPDAKGER